MYTVDLYRAAWGVDVPEGQVPFVVTLPNDKWDWYTLPKDVKCFRDGSADNYVQRN